MGTRITMGPDGLAVPDNPTIPFIEGDGIGPDIWASAVRVFDAAVEKAYGESRSVDWLEVEEDMPVSSGPVALSSGQFEDFDDFHMGSGTATIYELADGSQVLRLEDFEVTNGPDLHVLLVPNSSPGGSDDLEGYIDLGQLKGNIGDQNYDIPAGMNIADYGSVVIYCQPFHVIFSVAALT